MRRLIVLLLILTVPLGLTFLLTSTLPAVAEPVGVTRDSDYWMRIANTTRY